MLELLQPPNFVLKFTFVQKQKNKYSQKFFRNQVLVQPYSNTGYLLEDFAASASNPIKENGPSLTPTPPTLRRRGGGARGKEEKMMRKITIIIVT